MNDDVQFWKISQTARLVVNDSDSFKVRFWLQTVSGYSGKVFESRGGFEFAWKTDFSFELFLIFLEFDYGVLAALARS